jgi:Chromate resistance exported protein
MKWATRTGVHVERAACAWLIRRNIDNACEFIFVADPAEVPADAVPFNMPGVDLTTTATTAPSRPCCAATRNGPSSSAANPPDRGGAGHKRHAGARKS